MIINDRNLLKEIVDMLKKQNLKIVFTNGCFDIIHRGHVEYLNKAKKLGDVLIVGINSDESVKKIKGNKRPIIPLYSRSYVLDNLKPVDFVVPFDEETPIELIKIIKPDIHVKGGDYKEEDLPEAEIVKSYGGEVKIIPLIEGFSTTNIIEWVLEKYMVKK
ncbi:D-glycero-beta-D-manno-heptose 1-phosphate adenylyltransferase [Methanocaldococcus sp.]